VSNLTDWLNIHRPGVKLTREYSRPRRNIHSVIHKENAWYEKRMAELEDQLEVKDNGDADGNILT